MKKCTALLTALTLSASTLALPVGTASAEGSFDMAVTVDLSGSTKAISPYIFGINQYGNEAYLKNITATAYRQGGNRTTGYNWENNASNAGSDWKYSSDDNLSAVDDPADCAQKLSKDATTYGVDYKLATLQMAGYVAADKDGTVTEAETAPSDRWNEVIFKKPTAFADEPDLTDGVVYMDEYVNYIVNKLGNAKSATGIQAYSLDNEPALWQHTHSRLHPAAPTIAEISEKSIALASAVKAVDADAEIFGPALYGYTAYDHLADDDSSTEWETIKQEKGYNWYIDCYLDDMKKAEEKTGTRLLDVLDLHYYSESARVGAKDRLQSVRTLYEKGFAENSWIGQWCQANIPLLPTIQASIDKYYPGTKLGITEYNFGGEDCSGTIAQAEALGCFADAGVYYASLWGGNPYIYAGLNLYTNYDGKGGHFGDQLVPTKTEDVSLASAYASINDKDDSVVTAMLTNKSMTDAQNATIELANTATAYQGAAVYAVSGDSADIHLISIIDKVEGNKVQVTLPAMSAAMVVITDDADDLKDLEVYDPNKFVKKTVTIDNPSDYLNDKGYVVIPVEDPAHLVAVNLTGDVASSAGSSWGTAGCALCINAVDQDGNAFWTSKSFTLALGKGSVASVLFDGTLSNDGTDVPAVIADNKIEIQKWWDASEKQESADGDVISVEYTKIELQYEYLAQPIENKYGDVNCDGKVSITDLVMLARYVAEDSEMQPVSAQGVINADCTGDTLVNSSDIVKLARFLAHLIPESEMGVASDT